MGGLGGEELLAEVALGAGRAALACLAVLELEVRGEGDLVVAGAAEGFFAAGLGWRLVVVVWGEGEGVWCGKKGPRLTGSKVGLWAVVMAAVCW